MPLSGETEPVACFTEMIGQGTDESDFTCGALKSETSRRTVVFRPGNRDEFSKPGNLCLDFRIGDIVCLNFRADRSKRHMFDESDMIWMLQGKPCKIQEFAVIDPFEGDNVYFDGVKSQYPCPFNAFPDLRKTIVTCYFPVCIPIHGVQADIDSLYTCGLDSFQIFFKIDSIGGERNLFESRECG